MLVKEEDEDNNGFGRCCEEVLLSTFLAGRGLTLGRRS